MRRVVLQVVLPTLSVIFLIISYNSSYIVSLLNFIDQVTYTANYQLAINRTSLFLFFNAILLFVARDSGLLLAPSPGSDVRSPLPRTDELVEVKAIVVVVEEEAEVEISVRPCLELVVAEEESDQELVEDVEVEAIKEVDELNRRCEEFIEKFKRERLIEAKQPAGMVVC